MLHRKLTKKIIRSFYKVYNTLGYGFLEKVYENALCTELKSEGLKCHSQKPIKVFYQSKCVGEYFADIMVEEKIILELKATSIIRREHEIQLINYIKATEAEIGLLFNFGKESKFKREIYTNKKDP